MTITYKFHPMCLSMLAMAIFTFFLSSLAFAENQFQSHLLEVADVKKSGAYVRTRFLGIMKKPFTVEGGKKILIIGDSHAQDFLNSIIESGQWKNYQISTRYIPTRCQIYLGKQYNEYIQQKDKALCAKSDDLSLAKQQIAEADIIILAAKWREWSAKALPQTISNLKLAREQKLFVIGRKSFGKITISKYLRMQENQLSTLRNKVESQHHYINDLMSKTLSNDVFVNLHELVCGPYRDCPVFTQNLKLLSFDGGHLTKAGALYIGKILFTKSQLSRVEKPQKNI